MNTLSKYELQNIFSRVILSSNQNNPSVLHRVCRNWRDICSRDAEYVSSLLVTRDRGTAMSTAAGCSRGAELLVRQLHMLGVPADDSVALTAAAGGGSTSAAGYLLGHGAMASGAALKTAVRHGHAPMVELLLNTPVTPPHADADDSAALYIAVWNGRVDIARLLMSAHEHAASPVGFDSEALLDAVDLEDEAMVGLLIQYGAQANAQESRCLFKAVSLMNTEIALLLIRAAHSPADADARNGQALVEAVRRTSSDISMMEMLIRHGCRASAQNSKCLFVAVSNMDASVADILLTASHSHAMADAWDSEALIEACRLDDEAMVGLLIRHGALATAQGSRCLHEAVARGNIEIARLLMSDANPEAVADSSMLVLAASKGDEGMVQHLLLSQPPVGEAAVRKAFSVAQRVCSDPVMGVLRAYAESELGELM